MLLAMDIGNSSISIGLFACDAAADPSAHGRDCLRPCVTVKLSADTGRTADEYAVLLKSLLAEHLPCVTDAVIGSVVPQLTHTLEAAVRRLCGGKLLTVLHIGGGVRTGISLRVDDPGALGADIVTNAAAAVALYGAPVIFFDYGTATVCGAINAARELVGVSIAPGLYTSLAGLRAAAAQIPYIELKTPASALGKNTSAAVRAGLVAGTAAMTDGLIDRISRELGLSTDTPPPVVATGGLCELVLPACRHTLHPEPDLTLLGLDRIYRMTREKERFRDRDNH